jgi:beta-glucosidase
MNAGYQAQLQSVVMLKNKAKALPMSKGKKVYVPKRFIPAGRNFLGMPTTESNNYPISVDVLKKYYTLTDNPGEADFALVVIESPTSIGGYDKEAAKDGKTGYVPISLQYRPYTAQSTRNPSIGGGDPLENFTNRSYSGKSTKTINATDLAMVTDAQSKMNGKPVIVSVRLNNPMVFAELEPSTNAILANFGIQDQALLDIVSGAYEPSALLPMQMPANMRTVEQQAEDVPRDMQAYVDADGHTYDFGYGLNWKGIINDARTATYKRTVLTVR